MVEMMNRVIQAMLMVPVFLLMSSAGFAEESESFSTDKMISDLKIRRKNSKHCSTARRCRN